MRKLILTTLLLLIWFGNPLHIHATSNNLTTTATVSFYGSQPITQIISPAKTTLIHYTVDTWRDLPIINLFTKHDYHNDFYGLKFTTANDHQHQVKLTTDEVKLFHAMPYDLTLTWQNHQLLINNQPTKPIANPNHI